MEGDNNVTDELTKMITQYEDKILVGFKCKVESIAFVHSIPLGAIREMFLLLALDQMSIRDMEKTYRAIEGMTPSLQIRVLQQERYYFLKKYYQQILQPTTIDRKKLSQGDFSADDYVNRKYVDRLLNNQEKQINEMKQIIATQENEIKSLMDEKQLLQNQLAVYDENGSNKMHGRNLTYAASYNSDDTDGFFRRLFGRDVRKKKEMMRQQEEAKCFLQLFVDNKEFTEAQKNFLIMCREEGDSLELIQQWAEPELSVEMMERLRNVCKKKY